MPRRRYQLTDGDVAVVHRWVRDRFRNEGWPEDWPSLAAWDAFPLDKAASKKQQKTLRTTLQRWCDRFLDAVQWKQLHAVIRAARREKGQTRTVRLSKKAHETLHQLAKREKLTLSATIDRYLSDVLTAPTVHAIHTAAAPLQHPGDMQKPATPRTSQPAPASKVMKVRLFLHVENNSKFVRGKKKAREDIEWFVLDHYGMEKPRDGRGEYLLAIPYETDEDLARTIEDLLQEAHRHADDRHCFIETEVIAADDPDRSW
jgi:hypothetical protein